MKLWYVVLILILTSVAAQAAPQGPGFFESSIRKTKQVIVDSQAYKIVNYLIPFRALDEGSQDLMDIVVDYYHSGGRFISIPGGAFVVPVGGDLNILFSQRATVAGGKIGAFGLSLFPIFKVARAGYTGMKLMFLGRETARTAGGRMLTVAERQALNSQLHALGKVELAKSIAARSSGRKVAQQIAAAATPHLKDVRNWGLVISPALIVGLSLPAYPSSLRAPDIARFALTQGCLLAGHIYRNPTTKVLHLTGEKTVAVLEDFVVEVKRRYGNRTDITSGEAISETYLACESCKGQALSAEEVNRMSDEEVLETITATVEPTSQTVILSHASDGL